MMGAGEPGSHVLLFGVTTSGAAWHYFLWGSLATLLLAPTVLSRTRWGESRTLSICVTLSVLAHLLLMTYAYATRLPYSSFPHPGPGDGDGSVISLNLFGDDDVADGQRSPEPSPDEPAPTVEVPAALPVEMVAAIPLSSEPLPEPAETTAAESLPTPSEAPPELLDAAPPNDPPVEPPPAAVPAAPASPSELVDVESAAAAVAVRPMDRQPIPVLYRNRNTARRLTLALRFGGNARTEAAVNSALDWLTRNQSEDGRWDPALHGAGRESMILGQDRGGAGAHADTGITALALLALLGAGETHLKGDHREHVQHGLEFLLRNQRPDGELSGSAELFARMYCHSMATLALSEAYALTGDDRIRPYLERAVRYSVQAQDPTTGGWRYRPGDSGDMSQFGWQVMSLKSAQLSGFSVPDRTRTGMLRFLDLSSSGTARGLASYRPNERPSRTMTAEALVCRLFVGAYRDEQLREAERYIREELPSAGHENIYYWYYGTLAMFQLQGETWPDWNQALQRELLSQQRTDGELAGSWDPDKVWGTYGGRVFSTAMSALCLEVYYRYLPLYQSGTASLGSGSTRQ